MSQAAAPLPAPDNRSRILDAAEALFAERGLAGTAVRDIARSVGLTPASLYNHFAGKQALYEAVLDRGVRPLIEVMQGLSREDRTPAEGEELIDAVMAHLATRPHLPRLIQHEAVSGGAHLKRLGREWIRPLIDQGMRAIQRDASSPWDEDESALLMAAWLHLVFGHFAMAPLMAEVFGNDPLSPETLAKQTRFLRKLARMIRSPSPAPSAEPGP